MVRRSIGLRPYSSASWPNSGSTTILKIPTTCTHLKYICQIKIFFLKKITPLFCENKNRAFFSLGFPQKPWGETWACRLDKYFSLRSNGRNHSNSLVSLTTPVLWRRSRTSVQAWNYQKGKGTRWTWHQLWESMVVYWQESFVRKEEWIRNQWREFRRKCEELRNTSRCMIWVITRSSSTLV